MALIVVSVHIQDFNGTDGSAVVVSDTHLGLISTLVNDVTTEASTKAIEDWLNRRGETSRG